MIEVGMVVKVRHNDGPYNAGQYYIIHEIEEMGGISLISNKLERASGYYTKLENLTIEKFEFEIGEKVSPIYNNSYFWQDIKIISYSVNGSGRPCYIVENSTGSKGGFEKHEIVARKIPRTLKDIEDIRERIKEILEVLDELEKREKAKEDV